MLWRTQESHEKMVSSIGVNVAMGLQISPREWRDRSQRGQYVKSENTSFQAIQKE